MAAVALFLLAVAGYALLVHASPQYYWTQIDTAVYRDGGIAARNQPAMLYALELGAAKLPFTYTPFAALLFAAGSGASFGAWQAGLAVLTARPGCVRRDRPAGVPGHLVAPLRLRGTGPCPGRIRATAPRLPDPRRRAGGGLVRLVALAYRQPGRLRP